jgi:hypothetical protein
MTDIIRIDSGIKRVIINDGPEFIEFNPSDITFAEKFYELMRVLKLKQVEFTAKVDAIDMNEDVDADGMPTSMQVAFALTRETCAFFRTEIDKLLGEGTSQKLFGDSQSLAPFEQFFKGISTIIGKERRAKISRYIEPAASRKKGRHSVMK